MEFIKVNKTKARNLYNKGISIYIVPCKIYPIYNHGFINPMEINKQTIENEYAGYPEFIERYNFDYRVNNFEHYNCNYELGYYTSFYIVEND